MTCDVMVRLSIFTLNYVCMDGRGLKSVVGASILDLGEVIESDHAAIRVEIEWKRVMGQWKKKAQKKRCLNKQKWEVFGRRMNGKEFGNMSEMNLKDDTQRLICRTLHEHNGMVMQKLKRRWK